MLLPREARLLVLSTRVAPLLFMADFPPPGPLMNWSLTPPDPARHASDNGDYESKGSA